ncbi:hypothetical protein DDE18_16765 [Nocardioides gansuensis]|uniref:Uncharacterized protein n=1 Tax=Nocardioides gansuensis TaxID=2138300 RepID=A0A2T8F7F4_9ACTN|nr:hypothetical protein [Nocardioides gansuensis]PVG81646.1 hypothetical protein DDE18_16765 [Nocardioides gansuensis]
MKHHPLLGRDETTSDLRDSPPRPAARLGRWAGQALLVAILVAAALGLLGARTAEQSVESGSWRLHVEHAQTTRAGQPAPLHLRIEAFAGFGKTVQVRLCDDLFDDLDFQNWYPNPAAETSSPPYVVYEFDPPPRGEVLEVSLDARTAPGKFGEVDDCEVSVLVEDEPVLTTEFTVWRLP